MALDKFKLKYAIPVIGAGLAAKDALGIKTKQERIEDKEASQAKGLKESISQLPTYQVSEEAKKLLESNLALGKDQTNIARARTGAEAPGTAMARKDIQQAGAAATQNILEAGGGGANVLGAVAQAGIGEQGAMTNLAANTQQYQSQAERDLIGALSTQAGLESQGRQVMINEGTKAYESELNKNLTGIQFDTQQLSNTQADLQALKERRAQMISAGISAVGNVGTSLASGGLA